MPPTHLSSPSIAGIVVGTLLGCALLVALVLYLFKRPGQYAFTRVANPVRPGVASPSMRYMSSTSRRPRSYTRHSQRPSTSSHPLVSPASWPPLPATSRVLSPGTPPRLTLILPGAEDSQNNSFDLSEIKQVTDSPPPISVPLQPGLVDTLLRTRQTSGDGTTTPPTSPKSQQTLFVHRMIKSRAQASEGIFLAHRSSLSFSQSRSTTHDLSSIHADEEGLLAEVEPTALRDTEAAQRIEEERVAKQEEGWEEVESSESVYSQASAIGNPWSVSEHTSRQHSLSLSRRKSSQKQFRAPAPSELPPVTELPDTPRALERQTISIPVSTGANSSLEPQVSRGTIWWPSVSSVADQSGGTLPLLTSANFGKDSTTPGTSSGSITSTAGRGTGSSASRYPSLARSSPGQSLSHPDAGTDWHHPPPGLAGLSLLGVEPLANPYSPVEEQPEEEEMLADPVPVQRAHLRGGTACSRPEVERREVMQGGIAHIDVVL